MIENRSEWMLMLIFSSCLFVTGILSGQRNTPLDITIDFESYDPPSSLVVPVSDVRQARFPFVDVHSHHFRMAEQDLNKLIAEMDQLNMKVIVNLSGRGGHYLKAMTDNIKAHGYEDRILLFTNIELRTIDESDWAENTVKQIEYDIENGARGLKLYKSQGMFNQDKDGERIKITDPRLKPIWEVCGRNGLPVLIHAADPAAFWQAHDSLNERWLELKLIPSRKREDDNPASWETIINEQLDLFRQNPGTNFISAHFSWFANDLEHLGNLLDEIPNMYIETGAIIAELGRQPRMASKFFDRYQDRILFGKDAYNVEEYYTYFRVFESADEYFPYYKRYHAFWRMYGLDLPDSILKKLYYQNALKLIPGLKPELWKE